MGGRRRRGRDPAAPGADGVAAAPAPQALIDWPEDRTAQAAVPLPVGVVGARVRAPFGRIISHVGVTRVRATADRHGVALLLAASGVGGGEDGGGGGSSHGAGAGAVLWSVVWLA